MVLLLLASANAYIYKYDHQLLKLGHLEYRRVGMFTQADAPLVQPPGNGDSYIYTNVTFTRVTTENKIGILQLLVSHSATFEHIGFRDGDGNRHFCCTQELLDHNVQGCDAQNLGKAIISPHAKPPIQVGNVIWDSSNPSVTFSHKFSIPVSGRYYLLFSSCLNSTGDVTMDGSITWMNPYGYLPGELYHFIPMFYYLALGYLVLGVVWGLLCLIYRNDLLTLQHHVTFVIILGLLETTIWYHDYTSFNSTGSRRVGPVIGGVLLSSVKRTLSRLLVLIVCMGYGVMKPALSSSQRTKVICLGLVYFVFSSVYDIISSYSQMTFIMQHVRAFFLLPVAALDSLFFLWILQEISSNIQQLTERRQKAKLLVYRRFWQILVTTGVFSVMWAIYQVFVTMATKEDERWDSLWAFEGMWHVLYFGVLVAIAFLWRPSENAAAYAYSEQIHTDADDESVPGDPAFTIDDEDEDL